MPFNIKCRAFTGYRNVSSGLTIEGIKGILNKLTIHYMYISQLYKYAFVSNAISKIVSK